MRVIISGGGTGGHVFPAIAIANEIKKQNPDAEFLFVGAEGKLEMDRVPKAGYPIVGLPIQGFHRKLTLRNLAFPFKLFQSMWKARKVVKKFNPDVAVGVGGYASGPTLQMAAANGIPTLVQEQNSYAGVTNKILGRKANKVCVAYDGMEKFFPSEKIVFTGNPVRREIFENDITTSGAKAKLGLEVGNKTILIFGGSLGARALNESIESGAELLRQHSEINVIWQVGKLYYEDYKNSEVAKLPNVTVLPFIEDMASAYKAADLVVCRAGALTISELSLVVKAAILVPSPNVAEDHQSQNAMALVNKGAAKMVLDADGKEKLVKTMLELIDNDEERKQLENNISYFGKPNAAEEIAKIVKSLI
ncbi:MAG: UDP-N-acetylglucosamine--N-acetylmuramyl-(pentapeptide) pyrophosphoryl-undecaprenol N-acetylglucosamine transferase [Halioglobus sp.]|jgi:UDP-N-acetylglucosamine--N-acetylmuramyl-(pentapeptide) pyrophosphoryl-undecaprenol N-acetylglucosamine transferase